MPGKVFVSCGQASEHERVVVRELKLWFETRGFKPYVATQVHSIPDLNSGLIGELKRSDFYFFINFRREELATGTSVKLFRGSLYSNQELAVAYSLGFEHMLFLNQKGAERGGMFGTIVSNSPEFENLDEVRPAVERMVSEAGWSPAYSRHLLVSGLRWTKRAVKYEDHAAWEGQTSREHRAKILVAKVKNPRIDIAAHDAALRLKAVLQGNRPIFDGEEGDTAPLKVSGHHLSYSQIIWPDCGGEFDLLAMDADYPHRDFLNSKQDLDPRRPIIDASGRYRLTYDLVAVGFPRTELVVDLNLTGTMDAQATLATP